jgi:mRNA interferase HigB
LIEDVETSDWKNKFDLIMTRPDANKIYGDNFYFFDISIHKTTIMIVFHEQEAELLWVGTHSEYDTIFKGNKKTIETWIRNQGKTLLST